METNKQQWEDAYVGNGGKLEDIKDKTVKEIMKMVADLTEHESNISLGKGNLILNQIVASVSEKVNLGNYESKDFFCSMGGQVMGDFDPTVAYKLLAYKCKLNIEEQVLLAKSKIKK